MLLFLFFGVNNFSSLTAIAQNTGRVVLLRMKNCMDEKEQYQALLSDIIAKQIIILGRDIAVVKARNVPDIVVDVSGKVTAIDGDPKIALQKLVNEYVALSGQIVRNTLTSIFNKYPTLSVVGA